MEEAPTADKQQKLLNIDEANKKKEDNFQLAINYYSQDNPFKKVIIGSTVGVVSSFSASIVAIGISGAYISGGILFYDTAFVVGGYAAIGAAAGLVVAVPAILGGIGYGIYKVVKSKKLKNFIGKISNAKDESVNEEREILSRLTQECISYFKNYMNASFISNLKGLIIKDTEEILKKIKINYDNSINTNNIRKRIMQAIKEIDFFNIILIGNTGVGKSTLINGFLHLKNNSAKEGDTAEPQKIGIWPKKYPINENDTDIVGINLFDTEGIEKTGDNGFKPHLDKIVDFIHSPETNIKDKINAIWYCINSNRLDGDEEYINSIFKIFTGLTIPITGLTIPIIFIFTQAYRSRKKDIKMIKQGLEKFEYFKEHPNELHFVEVITKDLIDEDTGEVEEHQKGIDKLFEETVNVSDQTINAQFMKVISEVFNENSMKIIEKLSNKLQEQYNDIVINHDKLKTFDKKFYDIFENLYGTMNNENKNFIEQKISGWMKKIEEIQKSELKKAIKNYDNKYLINNCEKFIKEKYEEKKKKALSEGQEFDQEYKQFKEKISDYLITQINNSKDIYGLYSLFDLVRDSILEPIFKDLEIDLNKDKIETQAELQKTFIPQKIEELKNKIMTKK